MDEDYFPKNISYLLNNNYINVKKILQITGNTSPGLVTMWKNGERQITTKDLVKIANYLNLTVDELINKDLSQKKEKDYDELELLFKNNKDILNEEDKETIKFIVEKRKKNSNK